MDQTRTLLAAGVAFVAGTLSGVNRNASQVLLTESDLSPTEIGGVLAALTAFSILVSVGATFAGGYLWGREATVRETYPRFLGLLYVATLAGFALAYLPTLGLLLAHVNGSLLPKLLADGLGVLGLVTVPLVAFAGGAIAEFRRGTGT